MGIVAVFDGHNGAEASETASKLFLDYFYLHVYFLLNGAYLSVFRKSIEKFENKGVGDVVFHDVRLDESLGQDNAYPGRCVSFAIFFGLTTVSGRLLLPYIYVFSFK